MPERYNPFTAQVEPLDPGETMALFPLALRRSMMWDMVTDAMIKSPEEFGETPASEDVLEAEYKDMVERHSTLAPFGPGIDMYCSLAAYAATRAILTIEPETQNFTEEEKEQFLKENTRVSSMVTKSVLSQMLHKGLLHIGAH